MTQRIRVKVAIGIAITVAIVSLSLYWWRRQPGPPTVVSGGAGQVIVEDSSPVAKVKTVPLSYGRINETLTAYGIVELLPSTIEIYNVTFECIITRVLVTAGQVVNPGELLLIIKPSPDTQLIFKQAQDELESVRLEEALLSDRIKLQLSTKQDMVPVQLRSRLAEKKLNSLKRARC
ncbi:efflux RND transporter periplasmic adaptor subunit [Candidatus Kuenenia stuttgartiensis]|uniref:efflux RND transporter periplasmic adaptor subunit n=1 Tax=Kuenenia stuttgartiensis TaxID=174633 RepID=UPI00146B5AC6|nr:efflux RND transporter periplasmic adaptor subunit [Candidatus Kuenenia stuttgartiensis]